VKFYTIGYGGREPKDFLKTLQNKGVKAIVDVRLRPDRSRVGAYGKAKTDDKGIQNLLGQEKIKYYAFIELGNIFLECQDWPTLYEKYLEKAGDMLFDRFLKANISEPFCLLCAEKYVERDVNKKQDGCHRKQIADYLVKVKAWEVEHIEV
jgi:uncharacterized protein (DUF488 family)